MPKVILNGKNKGFARFLQEAIGENDAFLMVADRKDAIMQAVTGKANVLFLLPDYDDGKVVAEEFTDEEVEWIATFVSEGNNALYLENYPAIDSRDSTITCQKVVGFANHIGNYSLKLTGAFRESLGFELLQKKNGVYLPAVAEGKNNGQCLMEIRHCLGVHNAIVEEDTAVNYAVYKTCRNVYNVNFDLSCYTEAFTLPYSHWCSLYGLLFSQLLGIDRNRLEKAFRTVYSGIGITKPSTYKRTESEYKDALIASVKRAVSWHRDAGILIQPDGKKGVYEMIRSLDLKPAKNVRADSSMFTAAVFGLGGKFFEDAYWSQIAENIAEEMLINRKIQIEDGENRGLFRWFSTTKNLGSGHQWVWATDSGRVGNSIFALYCATKSPMLRQRLDMLGEAYLKWFGGKAFFPKGHFFADETDLVQLQALKEQATGPELYDAAVIFMKNMYHLTKDQRYKQQILKTAKGLAEIYPNYNRLSTTHSESFVYSRLLAVLSVAQTFESGPWTAIIDKLLLHFKALQHESGGFFTDGAYFQKDDIKKNLEFAVGFGQPYDKICDMVYCQNTMLYSLNILCKSEEKTFDYPLAQQMRKDCVDFLLNTQILSDNKLIDGGWMRAFDVETDEYYGCDKDYGWGAYCILTGWVTGAIPIVFFDMLGLPTIY